MSLEIFSNNKWHKFFVLDFLDAERVKEMKTVSCFASTLKATGEELNLIRQRIENVPIAKGRSCEWQQPFATFILNNLIEANDAS